MHGILVHRDDRTGADPRHCRAPPVARQQAGRTKAGRPLRRLAHASIAQAAAVRHERALGWFVHYATGIVFAALFAVVAGDGWWRHPTPGTAVAFGLATVAAPFFVMQPAMGAGFAASRTPAPHRNRLRSAVNHLLFGLGLYVAAALAAGLLHR